MAVTSGWTSAATGRSAANFSSATNWFHRGSRCEISSRLLCHSAICWASWSLFVVDRLQLVVADPIGHVGEVAGVRALWAAGHRHPPPPPASSARFRNSTAWTDSWLGWVFRPTFLNSPRSSISCTFGERDRLDPELGGGDVLLVELPLGDRLGPDAGLDRPGVEQHDQGGVDGVLRPAVLAPRRTACERRSPSCRCRRNRGSPCRPGGSPGRPCDRPRPGHRRRPSWPGR